MAKPPKYSQAELLEHIIERCDRIAKQLEGRTFEDVERDIDLLDATAYRLQAIGEACGKLDDAITEAYDLPWRSIIGMRHILSHDYLAMSVTIVWKAATESIGDLREVCRQALDKEQDE